MLITAPVHRALRLALVGALLFPSQAFARVRPDINLGTISVLILARQPTNQCGGGVNPTYGSVEYKSPLKPHPNNSPGIDPAPSFHSGNTFLSVWGLGWTSDIDHQINLNGNRTITWTTGDGVHVTYFQTENSSTTPVYTPPINAYESITTVSASSGVPTVLLERDTDGTTRRFEVFESTTILRLALLTDPNGNTIDYTRDGYGRLTRVEDIHGRNFNLTYDGAGLVYTLSDSAGRTSTYLYDGSKRRTSEAGPLGTTAYQYDGSNRMTKITYPNGGVKNYAYDSEGRVKSEDDGGGANALNYAYYTSSTTVTDTLGRVVKYDYVSLQGLKKISKITDPAGGVTTYAYDSNLNLTSETDPLGRVTRYSYDAKGNVTQTDDAASGHTYTTYESTFNLVASITDPLSHATNFTYDTHGNQILITNALSGTIAKTYDSQGHVTRLTDPLSHYTDFTYESSNGSLETITDPLSRVTSMVTDGLSQVTQNTDPASKVTHYEYDSAGDLTKVTDALGHDTVYAYSAGRDKKLLTSVTDANGHVTTFNYDPQGRLIKVTNALGRYRTSQYNSHNGTLTQTTNARGQTINYTYNSRKQLTRKATPEGNINYAYDAAGNMTSMTHYNGSALTMTYDELNRVTQVVQRLPGGYEAPIGYGYDAAGNRTSMTTPWGNFSYQYDALNRLTRITNPQSKAFDFAYDTAGRRTQLDYPNGVRTTYGYDNAGQVLSILHIRTTDQFVVAKATYNYDNAGNRLTMTDTLGRHAYSYDDLHRLSSVTHPSGSFLIPVEAFSYDSAGNRLADMQITSYTYNNINQLMANSSFTYTYDYDGNRIEIKDKLTNNATSFSFNSENQLVGATRPSGESWVYKYARPGQRVEKSSGTASSQKQRFVYDGDNILAILDGGNSPIQVFTVGLKPDEVLSMRSGTGTDQYLHTDAIQSVRALTSTSSAITESYEYLSFGKTLVKNAAGSEVAQELRISPLLYTGKLFDDEIGTQNSNHRQLDEQSGIFMSEDPLGIEGGTNLYSYVENNPIKLTDSLGLKSMSNSQAYNQCFFSCFEHDSFMYCGTAMSGSVAAGALIGFLATPQFGGVPGGVAGAGFGLACSLPVAYKCVGDVGSKCNSMCEGYVLGLPLQPGPAGKIKLTTPKLQ